MSYNLKQDLINKMMEDLKNNLSLSNLVSLSEAEFVDSLAKLKENLANFKKSNEIGEDFVK